MLAFVRPDAYQDLMVRMGNTAKVSDEDRIFRKRTRYAGIFQPEDIEVVWENPRADLRRARIESGETPEIEKDERIAKLARDYQKAKQHPDEVPVDELSAHLDLRRRFNLDVASFAADAGLDVGEAINNAT